MTELTAAIGIEQLKKLDKFNDIRIENARYLTAQLAGIKGLQLPKEVEDTKHVYYFYGMFYNSEEVGIPRAKFIQALKQEGIPCYGGTPHPLYKNPIFLEKTGAVDYTKVKCENAEKLCYEHAVWVTIVRPPCTLRDMDDIVAAIKKIIENKELLK